MKLKDVAEIKFCLAAPTTRGEVNTKKVLLPTNLLDKTILDLTDEAEFDFEVSKYKVDDDAIIEPNIILIKRIGPTGIIFVEKISTDIYASGNMILIRARSVDSKFLACILNKSIPNVVKEMEGTRFPTLTRKIIDEIDIPVIDANKQVAIGDLWFGNHKLYKLRKSLITNENILNDNKIYEYISNVKENENG